LPPRCFQRSKAEWFNCFVVRADAALTFQSDHDQINTISLTGLPTTATILGVRD
jgi:hypothetical protein